MSGHANDTFDQRRHVTLSNVTAAEQLSEPHAAPTGSDIDGSEPTADWTGDAIAARKFGSPEAIRAALLPEQVAEFDAALLSARTHSTLMSCATMLRAWRRIALMTERDPQRHRETLAPIAEIQRTRRPRAGSVPWDELKAQLGL
jgi:hypothetical protein